jgi:hypothetical protein
MTYPLLTATRPRRPLTSAQQQATEERRARFRAIAARVAAMTDDERVALAARIAPVTVEGHPLSVHNACLAVMQRADVTVMGGFQQWLRAGRQVRKGEHGIMIWAPGHRDEGRGEDADGVVDEPRRGSGFVPVTVFDVAQTEERTER